MRKATLKRMEKELLRMKEEIIRELSRHSRYENVEEGKDVGDLYDDMAASREKELEIIMSDRERKKLQEIEEALKRIKEGTYGICEECGDPIPEARLEVMPFARVCVDCKEKLEKEEKSIQEIETQKFLKKLPLDDFNIEE